MAINFVKSTEDFDNYVSNNKYLVANFTASWCGPCQAIKPLVDSIYSDQNYLKIEIVRVDLDSQSEIASRYNVTAIPTFIFFEAGNAVETIKGATPKIKDSIESFKNKAEQDPDAKVRAGNGGQVKKDEPILKEIGQLVPKGYQILNDNIFSGDFEALNCESLNKTKSVKQLFDLNAKNGIYSDADSQLLLYVPFTNISKVYLVLIKTSKVEIDDNSNLDEDDLDECQYPNLIKIWPNKLGILSFDDAVSDKSPAHIEALSLSDGWYECRLKYVRFQNVQSLNIFFDGDDSDYHTVVEKVVIVGVSGEEKEQNMDKLHGEES